MKILHVVPTYAPAWRYGGPIRSVHSLCRALAERGHDVHVYTTNVDGPDELPIATEEPVYLDGVKVWYFPVRFRRLYWSTAMRRAITERVAAFDFVHLHSLFLWPTWAAARFAERAQVPYCVAPRGMLVKDLVDRKSGLLKRAWLALIERHTLEHAAFFHATSELEGVEARAFGYQLPDIVVVANGVESEKRDVTYSSPDLGIQVRQRHLLFLGRVNWKKGLDRLIPALKNIPNTELLIAGNDEENYRLTLDAIASREGVQDRVRFLGMVNNARKAELFQEADLLILPSYSENFGNVVLEAWAAGCPVAVTKEVGLAEVIAETGAGAVVPGDPAALGHALAQLLDQPAQLAAMKTRGLQVVAERFSWQTIAQQMEETYLKYIRQAGK